MSEIIKEARGKIDEIMALLQAKKDKSRQSKIKEKLSSLEREIEGVCRADFAPNLKLDLLEALKKLLKTTHSISKRG